MLPRMPVTVYVNAFHPDRDEVVLEEPWTVEELRAAARTNPRPLAYNAVPGTDHHRRLLEAGAVVYQQCPPLQLDAASPEVHDWCRAHALLPVEDLQGEDVSELWAAWYELTHRSWSPSASVERLRELFTDLVAEIDVTRGRLCRVDGQVVALAFVFPGDDPEEIVTEALLPEHPRARDAVASCMAATLRGATGTVRFDGHVGDPHFAPLWATVPGVYASEGDPVDLLEIPCR